jgi:phosphoglycolate phosphatase-like HAD superfamily hydrolase
LATGGWGESARTKLRHAGIEFDDFAFTSADDAPARTDIMKACWKCVADRGVPITETVYVGDGVWDAEASRTLGWQFVGIGDGTRAERLKGAGAREVFADFRDHQAVLAALGAG